MRELMWRIVVFLLLVPVVWANQIVAAKIYEQKDFGTLSLDEFLYSLNVDCTAGTIKIIVMDENFSRVQEANTYLKYVDFAQPLISTIETDKDGVAIHKLPGNVKLMRGFFIMVIQKSGFRNKEIHFDISGCYIDGPVVQPKPPGYEEPEEEIVEAPEPEIEPEEPVAEENITEENEIVEEQPEKEPVCAISFVLALLLFFKMTAYQSKV